MFLALAVHFVILSLCPTGTELSFSAQFPEQTNKENVNWFAMSNLKLHNSVTAEL